MDMGAGDDGAPKDAEDDVVDAEFTDVTDDDGRKAG